MTAYFSLGSNLGRREENLGEAILRLGGAGVALERQSSLYETAPRDVTNQPWFLNMVVAGETALPPEKLLRAALGVEASMGRIRVNPKGPRVIDIDLLLLDDLVFCSDELQIPHPRMYERRFVLEPLAEIAPELRDPRTGRLFREILTELGDQVVQRAGASPARQTGMPIRQRP